MLCHDAVRLRILLERHKLHTGSTHFLENCLECREISMYVIDRRDPFHKPIQTSEPNRRKADP